MTGQQHQMGPWDSCLLQPGRLYRYATSLYEGFLTVRRVETGLVSTYSHEDKMKHPMSLVAFVVRCSGVASTR